MMNNKIKQISRNKATKNYFNKNMIMNFKTLYRAVKINSSNFEDMDKDIIIESDNEPQKGRVVGYVNDNLTFLNIKEELGQGPKLFKEYKKVCGSIVCNLDLNNIQSQKEEHEKRNFLLDMARKNKEEQELNEIIEKFTGNKLENKKS